MKLSVMIAQSWAAHNTRNNKSSSRDEFEGLSPDAVSFAMGYGRGLYCGD